MLAEEPEAPFQLHFAEAPGAGLELLSKRARRACRRWCCSICRCRQLRPGDFAKVYAHSPQCRSSSSPATTTQTVALSAVKGGAQDYLVKSRLDRELLLRSMQYSIERKRYQAAARAPGQLRRLTGLPNRNLLHDRLRQAVYAQRSPRAMAVVFIDLDHSSSSTTAWATAPATAACAACRSPARVLAEGDTVARLGGDEFVVILNDQGGEEVIFRAMQRIMLEVSQPMMIDGKELYVTCSAGTACTRRRADVDTLLKNADAAMYRAKDAGATIQFFTPR